MTKTIVRAGSFYLIIFLSCVSHAQLPHKKIGYFITDIKKNDAVISSDPSDQIAASLSDYLNDDDEIEIARKIADQESPSSIKSYMQEFGVWVLLKYLDIQESINRFFGYEE